MGFIVLNIGVAWVNMMKNLFGQWLDSGTSGNLKTFY